MTTATFQTTSTQNHPAIQQALQHLADLDRDHASVQNGVGFNGRDTDFGCSLAKQSATKRLSDKQHELACKLLWRYSNTQLAPAGIDLPVLGDLQKWLQERERIYPYKPAVVKLPTSVGDKGSVYLQDGLLTVKMPSNYYSWVKAIKTIQVQGRLVARYLGEPTRLWQLPTDWLDALQTVLPTTHFDYSVEVIASKEEQEKRRKIAALEQEIRKEAAQVRVNKLLKVARLDEPLANGWLLKPHQKEAVEFVLQYERVLIGDQQGVGKTLEALKAAKTYQDIYGCDIFCVVPVSVKDNWYKEASYVGCNIQVVSNSAVGISKVTPTKKFVLIIDESHALKNLYSQRTKAALALAESPHLMVAICMTGTPIDNGSPMDIFPTLRLLKHPLGANKSYFEQRYCHSKAALRELYQILTVEQPVMIRRKLADVTDLPPFTRQMVDGVLSKKAALVYSEKFTALQEEYNRKIADDEISNEGWHLVLLNHLRHAGSLAKVDTVVARTLQFLEGIDGEDGEQVVVFTVFKDTAAEIANRLKARNYTVDILSGATRPQDRDPMVQRFQSGSTNVIVCMIQAGGVGITLTAASKVILADRDWKLNEQAESRINRISQDEPTTALWVRHTLVDEYIDNLLITKAETASLILEGYSSGLDGIDWNEEAKNLLAQVFNGSYAIPTDLETDDDVLPDYGECF